MPLAMGAVMGLMMLWMVHMQITGDGARSRGALLVFVGTHMVLIAALVILPLIASRRLGWVRRVTDRLHRPSLRHIALMLTGAALATAITHVAIHGGVI
mmetsp:Transcript_18462/g.30107  ORF Transcript_18462/g.30107 Transcript_18462/m.30107 type:complete len:99 (+) Transcript_18462:12345-12641(+)